MKELGKHYFLCFNGTGETERTGHTLLCMVQRNWENWTKELSTSLFVFQRNWGNWMKEPDSHHFLWSNWTGETEWKNRTHITFVPTELGKLSERTERKSLFMLNWMKQLGSHNFLWSNGMGGTEWKDWATTLFLCQYFGPDVIPCGWLGLKHQLTN